MTTKIEKLSKILNESKNIVFFGGAGMSTYTHNKFRFLCDKKIRQNYIFHLYSSSKIIN